MHKILNDIEKQAQLITLPKIYLRLRELLDDPEYTMAEVVLLVSHDPGLATRFLRVVNSPLNRRNHAIETVSRAISLLGSQQVHDIVLCASIAEAFDGLDPSVIDMKAFWRRSVYCASLAKLLAEACDEIDTDRLFTMGLLLDLGHLFMIMTHPESMQQIYLQSKEEDRHVWQLERERFGVDYAQVGSFMMRKWRLPQDLIEAVKAHLEPSSGVKVTLEPCLLHLSQTLVQADLSGEEFGEGLCNVDEVVWSQVPLTTDALLAIRQEAAQQCEAIAQQIFS